MHSALVYQGRHQTSAHHCSGVTAQPQPSLGTQPQPGATAEPEHTAGERGEGDGGERRRGAAPTPQTPCLPWGCLVRSWTAAPGHGDLGMDRATPRATSVPLLQGFPHLAQ